MTQPTPHAEVNDLLRELLESIRAILGSHFIGLYLDGSLAAGDFDEDSDVDFVVVTDRAISGDLFLVLQTMHDRLAASASPYATQLEGSYISRSAIRRHDPAQTWHPNIERGQGERLKMTEHDAAWVTHRFILREHGVTLAGPDPKTLIDPISPNDLRQAMLAVLQGWATLILNDPTLISNRGYQSYTVLSLCRIRYTLQQGTVVSKRVTTQWAQEMWGERWAALIERAWVRRHHPGGNAEPSDVNGTLALIRETLELSQRHEADDAGSSL